MQKCIAFIILLAFYASHLQAQSITELMERGKAIDETDYKAALDLYNKVLLQDETHFEALWRGAFVMTKIGTNYTDKNAAKFYFEIALERAQKAYSINPNSYQSNYVLAVAYGRLGDVIGAKERVQNSEKIKQLVERAVELNPNHAASLHILGKLHYRLTNLNVAEKAAANLLWGGLPQGVSNELAAQYYQRAVDNRPDYILYYLDLALAHLQLKDRVKAREVLNKAIALPARTEDDPMYIKKCQELLRQIAS